MFLAMTEEEIQSISPLPSNFAYLGCHFSPAASELTGLPPVLPPGCGIILDDRYPIPDTDPDAVAKMLSKHKPQFVLLDFQHPPTDAAMKLAAALVKLPCPVPMPPAYGQNLTCPLFLPPVLPHVSILEYLEPWQHREIWLELALDAIQIEITAQGSRITHFPHAQPQEQAHTDRMLHCHYKITRREDALSFYCYRTREDITALLHSPLPANVTHTIGLFRELGDMIR